MGLLNFLKRKPGIKKADDPGGYDKEEEIKEAQAVRFNANISGQKPGRENMRIIKTARDLQAMNEAARSGLKPLLVKVTPSKEIHSKLFVFQNINTGEIKEIKDFRDMPPEGFVPALSFGAYYPYKFPAPYAAYLLPQDLEKNEWVFIEDLIEDMVGAKWNQGDVYRLDSVEAKWNGEYFETDYTPETNSHTYIG